MLLDGFRGRAKRRAPEMATEISLMTDIDHLIPPTGHMANNVVGFARALRAAGIPVGPGAVIDALNALQAIEIGNRADVYATLESIYVTRHPHDREDEAAAGRTAHPPLPAGRARHAA